MSGALGPDTVYPCVSTWGQVLLGFGALLELPQDSLGFGLWLQLMCCTYLLTVSEYFKWRLDFRLGD